MILRRHQTALLALFLCTLAALLAPTPAAGQTLSVGSGSGLPGASVDLAVNFTAGGTGVSSLQFDLKFSSSLTYASISTGAAATAAGKSALGNAIAGGMRVVLSGFNSSTIGSGTVAVVRVGISAGAAPGAVAVSIAEVVASDPGGNGVGITGTGGTVTVTAPADTTPPIISAVSASSITVSGATVSWTTNEPSSSQVDFGTTIAYGASTSLNTGLVTSHSQTLTGLAPSTLYHYRVRSRDGAGNLASSTDYTFTTVTPADTTPPVIAAVTSSNVTSSGAAITWTTNEVSNSQVEYGTTTGYGSSTGVNTSMVTHHAQSLGGLAPATLYHYRVKSRDAGGNWATSADYTFTTTASNDTTAPAIRNVSASAVTKATALILWSTDESADSQVEYGTGASYGTSTPLNAAAVTSHAQLLSGLTAKTQYHYRVRSRDGSGNLATSDDHTFTTSDAQDTAPPVISAVTVSGIGHSRATVTWSTNKPADSQVEYGTVESYGFVTALRPTLAEAHAEVLTGLTPKTTYHFRVKSKDADGNMAVSADLTFTTGEKPNGEAAATMFYPLMSGGGEISQPGEGEDQYVGVAIANLDSGPATLTFTAYGPSGEEISGPSITNPATRVLYPTQQLPVVDTELFGDAIQSHGTIGWIKVESTVAKVAGFFLMFNARMSVLDGANISSHPMTSFVLPEIDDQGFTRVDIANPSADPAELSFELVRADGTTAAETTRTVLGNGAVVTDLFTDLFPDTTPAASYYLRVSAQRGVLAFELFGKGSQYVDGLNGQDAAAGATTLYSPQYAVGGPWRSALSIVNLDNIAGTVTFRFIRDDATQVGSTKVLPIEAHGKIRIDDPALFQSLFVNPTNVVTQGYIEIVSSGIRLSGSVLFGDPEGKMFSAALPLVDKLQRSVLFSHVASDQTYFTGIAILNPNTTDATATLDLYGADGRIEASTVMTIPGRQRKSMVLTEYFPALVGQNRNSGYVKVTADKEVAAFALFGSNDLSVLSAIPPQDVP